MAVRPSLLEDPQDQGHWVIASTWTPTSRSPPLPPIWSIVCHSSPPSGEVTVSVVIESRGEGENLGYITSRSRGQHCQEAGELERGEKLMSRMMGFLGLDFDFEFSSRSSVISKILLTIYKQSS